MKADRYRLGMFSGAVLALEMIDRHGIEGAVTPTKQVVSNGLTATEQEIMNEAVMRVMALRAAPDDVSTVVATSPDCGRPGCTSPTCGRAAR
ncbi:hypothetical protein Aph01nite_34350 [Acrocarpospora phusangensis]|uniref:Uncharacterized protein n=1 Tax=Acrocarpospora phusangensis TaxID=1070424 RepID=A0A919QD12_9ACTN|nr:hypothetical protein [Acrocarpospora phusangensis]GIH25125.1 hypothetical protein Aph01nite_34350 [Acrocarpospora phusangensis]